MTMRQAKIRGLENRESQRIGVIAKNRGQISTFDIPFLEWAELSHSWADFATENRKSELGSQGNSRLILGQRTWEAYTRRFRNVPMSNVET
jgi:hypothetical protein